MHKQESGVVANISVEKSKKHTFHDKGVEKSNVYILT
jgi:hypothetical protein